MTAYIDAADVIGAMPRSTRPDPDSTDQEDVDKLARITSLCVSTGEMIDAEIGSDFHRHPAGDETVTWYVDGRGSALIHLHQGVVSLTSVAYRYSSSSDWTEYEAGDWELVSMFDQEGDRPYDHLRRTVGRWPTGVARIRLTGVRGWDTPPARLRELNVAWVRQHLAAGDSFSGAMQTPDGFIPTPRLSMPDDVRMFLTVERGRYKECWT